MSPSEAAELLGVSPAASPAEVERAYEARLSGAGADVQRRDALTAARDALLAASAWHAPAGQSSGPAAHGQQQPPVYPAPAWYPPAPPRRGLSTGAIVGITLGSIAAGIVVLLVAGFALLSIAHSSSRLAEAGAGASPSAAPSDVPFPVDPGDPAGPTAPTDPAPDPAVEDYDVDGVHVHYVDGWTFELTAGQSCAGATVTAGFSDSPDGDEVDQWTTTVDLEAGVPLTFTIPDSASSHDFAGIDGIDCGQA